MNERFDNPADDEDDSQPDAHNTDRRVGQADSAAHPYELLTPDVVLDALASVGLWGDGRLTALSSYENRVYQISLESPAPGDSQAEAAGDTVVAKFYRPGRWSDGRL